MGMSRECAPLPMPMSVSYMPPPTHAREAFKPWVGGGGYPAPDPWNPQSVSRRGGYPAPDLWNPQSVSRRGSFGYDGRRNYNGRRINNRPAVCCWDHQLVTLSAPGRLSEPWVFLLWVV